MMVALWVLSIGVYVLHMYRFVRAEERELAREEAERQAERDRRREVMRQGADWAMSMTPREWVKS